MAIQMRMFFLAIALTAGTAMAANAPKVRTYILNGYSFTGVHGVNATEMEAKLKHHEGARITRADIAADTAILTKELQARHIKGQLFTTLAESKGRVWIIFDVLTTDADKMTGQLETLSFQGAARLSSSALAAATGLKKGDQLTQQKLISARRGIMAAYAKALPKKKVSIKLKLQHKRGDKVELTWIIVEPK